MVFRQFPYGGFGIRKYPRTGAERLGRQTDNEQENQRTPPPFNPEKQPDRNLPYAPQPVPETPPPQFPDVRHIYDSRPLFGYDFYWEEFFQDGQRDTQAFRVPQGYNLVLRGLQLDMVATVTSSAGAQLNMMGALNVGTQDVSVPKLQIHVDDVATPQWTPFGSVLPVGGGAGMQGVPIHNAFWASTLVPLFVIVPGGSTFTIFIPNYMGITGNGADITVAYHGNLLLSTGRDPRQEIANEYPLPVTMSDVIRR